MNILVIFTGGTIASCENDGFLAPNEATKKKLLALYEKKNSKTIEKHNISFDSISPYQILSENLDAHYINQLVACIKSILIKNCARTEASATDFSSEKAAYHIAQEKSYDGIIVTHGTDTLQYTAAALGLCFRNTSIPILLVSSNYILSNSRANGLANFTAAVEYICEKKEAGVFVSYANQGQPAAMYPATKLFAHLPYSDELYTTDDLIDINTFDDHAQDIDFASISLCEQSPVLFFHAMPGQIYPTLTDSIKAIIIESYHSGTLCTAGSSLKSFCENAFAKNIPIYLVGVEDRTAYESTKAYEELHIKVLPKVSPVTAYMLAWYLYSRK